MDAALRDLAAAKPVRPIRVMGWGGGGFVPGRTTLFNAVLDAAGGTDIATNDGYYDVEGLIAAKPDVLAYGDDYIDTPCLRMDQNAHPVLLTLYRSAAHRLSRGAVRLRRAGKRDGRGAIAAAIADGDGPAGGRTMKRLSLILAILIVMAFVAVAAGGARVAFAATIFSPATMFWRS